MPEIFDIAGSIILESNAFQGSVRAAEARLKGLDSALDSTISKSNKLGDTSATVARRYEKLAEGIKAQRDRLLDNALAFEKGELSAQQFSNVVVSVDKATTSLSGKLKDAKARVTELNEVGLTHFQQQVAGAVENANSKLESFRQQILQTQKAASPQSTDLLKNLFGNLSGFQKTQLSFQLNDIISGLAMGQSPMQILAQQGGQVVQILQQGKPAAEGIATATATAAASEAAFAASAKASAISQTQVATSSAATAASMESAAAASTILGASVVSLGAILAAGLVTIGAVYRLTQDIQKAAEKRLQNEIDITAALNKQALIQQSFKERLAGEQGERNFSGLLQDSNAFSLQTTIAELTRQRDAAQRVIDTELANRVRFAEASPGILNDKDKDGSPKFLNVERFAKSSADAVAKLNDQLSKSVARLDELQKAAPASVSRQIQQNTVQSAINAYQASVQAQAEAEIKLAEHRKKLLEEAKQKAKEWLEHIKGAQKEIVNIVSGTSQNPFVKLFLDGEQAVQKMLEATKGLGAELQNNLRKLIESDTATKAFKQSMENSLKASGLRSEAAQFLGRAKPTISENLQNQLNAIGGGSPFARARDFAIGANGVLTEIARAADPNQRARDQKIIELTRGLADDALTPTQKQQAAAARLREASALERERPDALQIQKDTLEVLRDLKGQKALQIEVSDPQGLTSGIKSATPQTVNARYKR